MRDMAEKKTERSNFLQDGDVGVGVFPEGEEILEYMSAIGRKGGQIGGKRRLKTMTKAERSKIAAKAAKARWKNAKPDRSEPCAKAGSMRRLSSLSVE